MPDGRRIPGAFKPLNDLEADQVVLIVLRTDESGDCTFRPDFT